MCKPKSDELPFSKLSLILAFIAIVLAVGLLFHTCSTSFHTGVKHPAAPPSLHPAKKGIFTAYTSRSKETDNTPYTTADGSDLRKLPSCVVANNKIKMGTKVEIQGFGTCEVHDRMKPKYAGNRFDIYMGHNVKGAKEFGKRRLAYRIIH